MCVRAVEKRTNQGKDVTITTLMYTVARRKMDKMVKMAIMAIMLWYNMATNMAVVGIYEKIRKNADHL